jgi:hypothetical protein
LSAMGFGAAAASIMVVSYIASLLIVYLLSLIVNALAPTFGGQKDSIAALKLVAYGATAGFVGGVFSLLPALWALNFIAGLYSIYLIYLGVPVLMKSPAEKSLAYTAVIVVSGIVLGVLLNSLMASFSPYGVGRVGAASFNMPAK